MFPPETNYVTPIIERIVDSGASTTSIILDDTYHQPLADRVLEVAADSDLDGADSPPRIAGHATGCLR